MNLHCVSKGVIVFIEWHNLERKVSFQKTYFIINYMCPCVYMPCECRCSHSPEWWWSLLELRLWAVVSLLTWMLGTELSKCSGKVASVFTCWAILLAPLHLCWIEAGVNACILYWITPSAPHPTLGSAILSTHRNRQAQHQMSETRL